MNTLEEFKNKCNKITEMFKADECVDGVIDPESYFNQKTKLLWVLKKLIQKNHFLL